jgi:acetyltransferase
MSIRNLEYFFEPESVAVIGASERPGSVGATVLRNVLDAGFKGAVLPVNPKYDRLAELEAYRSVSELPCAPHLAVICTPPATVPGLIAELGRLGTRAAVVLTAGLDHAFTPTGTSIKQAMLDAARPCLLRILGPNCVGLLAPRRGLNASFAHAGALPGTLAFVSQSGALVTGVLDWAKTRGIGFSKFVSLGDGADIDFGDLLDYLANDAETHAILLYMEDIRAARKFMSAARAAARSKPVLVLKAGRAAEGARAAASHTGALAGADDVYDAAIRRAGMLRVYSTDDLFAAVETLARARPLQGDRLAIMTNGGGPGVMATDALVLSQGRLAELSAATLRHLDEVLPPTWSRANPVDIIGDAPVERYVATLQALLQDEQVDAVLLLHAPTAIVPSDRIAQALAPVARAAGRNVISCWLGGASVARAREIFYEAGLPTYDTPEDAVEGYMQIVRYRRNQQLLMEVAPAAPAAWVPQRAAAQALVRAALEQGRTMLTEPEAKELLKAYAIPVVETGVATGVEEAVRRAGEIGFPCAIKILSPDISHKSDVGGVALDLDTPQQVRDAAEAMLKRLRRLKPEARLEGFSVQAMARRPDAHELIVGLSTDPVFGPVILFGSGGIAVEVNADRAIGLPPLNMNLARDMVSRTRVARLLAGYRNRPPADLDEICRTLIKLSHLAADLPEVLELDVNPLWADADGVMALDARVRIAAAASVGAARLAIRPYPEELEQRIVWQRGELLLRPIKPEDAARHDAFFHTLDQDDIRYRIFTSVRELQPSQLARLTQIDYDREMAFIAVRDDPRGEAETLGVARALSDPDNVRAEFAIIVRSDLKGQGLGRILLEKLIGYCAARGMREIVGEALVHNRRMLDLARELGFRIEAIPGGDTVRVKLEFGSPLA